MLRYCFALEQGSVRHGFAGAYLSGVDATIASDKIIRPVRPGGGVNIYLNIISWSCAGICNFHRNDWTLRFNVTNEPSLSEQIGAKLPLCGFLRVLYASNGGVGSSFGFSESSNQIPSPNTGYGSRRSGNGNADPCYYLLPISGCSGIRGGVGGLALGGQIVGLMLLGIGCALLFGRSVFLALESPEKARWKFWLYALPLGALVFFFYGWAWFGHPLAFWGLR